MAYVKKFDHGTINMDLPYFSYIYQLPLFTFGDTLGSLGVSLVFNYRLFSDDDNNDNAYNIKQGYKLNLQKRLMISDTGAYSFQDENGKTIGLESYDDISLRFLTDESQRFVYQQGSSYVLEYPDSSKEIFASNGNIISVVDKYGNTVLTYSYDATNKLTSITYRGEKTISLTYDNLSRVKTVSYGGKTTNFEYSENDMQVQFCTGDIVLIQNLDFNFSASVREFDSTNSLLYHKETKVVGNQFACAANIINSKSSGNEYESNIRYTFPTGTIFGKYSNQVKITNERGVKKRVQFIGDKPSCSYELNENDVEFWYNNREYRFSGNVQVYKTYDLHKYMPTYDLDDPEKRERNLIFPSTSIAIDQQPRDAWPFRLVNGSDVLWQVANSELTGEYLDRRYVFSGWYKVSTVINSEDVDSVVIDIGRALGYYDYTLILSAELHDQWKYFAVTLSLDGQDAFAYLRNGIEAIELKDLRLTSVDEVISDEDTGAVHISMDEEGVIRKGDQNLTFMHLHKFEFLCNNNPVSDFDSVSYNDVLRNVINYKKGVHKNCFLCGGVNNAAPKAENEIVQAIYNGHDDDESNNVVFGLNQLYPAKRRYVKNIGYVTTYAIDDDTDAFLTVKAVDDSGNVISSVRYNEFLDVISFTKDGVTQATERDVLGRITREAVLVSSGEILHFSSMSYGTSANNPTVTYTDEFQNSTVCTLDPVWGNVISTTLPDGTVLTDEYDDSMSFVTKKTFGNSEGRNIQFGYPRAFSTTLQTGDLSYGFDYRVLYVADSSGELVKTERTTVTNQDFSIATYDSTLLTENSYYPSVTSPSYSVKTNLDKYGRVASVDGLIENEYDIIPEFNSATGERITHLDNADSLLATTTDLVRGTKARYSYDGHNHLVKKTVTNKNSYSIKISDESFAYDKKERLTEHTTVTYVSTGTKSVKGQITYTKPDTDVDADEQISRYAYTVDGGFTTQSVNTYDSLKRISKKTVTLSGNSFEKTYTYDITRLSKLKDAIGGSSIAEYELSYDDLGRISSQQRKVANTVAATSYVYDVYGQLVRENNQILAKTFTYEYDAIGNITKVREYPYNTADLPSSPSSLKSFTYDTTNKDRLTGFNLSIIAYNASGYISSYKGESYTWQKGRLSSIQKGNPKLTTGDFKLCSFTYDAYGQRTKKSYQYKSQHVSLEQGNPTYITDYTYDHMGRLIRETCVETNQGSSTTHTHNLVYLYDESKVIGVMYGYDTSNLQAYYYHRNAFGDVISIHSVAGATVAEYAYDAYGNCTIVSGATSNLANYNPIRYRGYYYDRETGLYYLNARYYNPEWRRFISTDEPSYLDSETPNGLNLYCYCMNNPIMYADPSGHWIETVFDLFSLGASVVEVVINPANPWAWAGLVGDAVDLLPFVAGVGEGIRATKMVKYTDDVIDASYDTIKFVKAADMVDDFSDRGTMLRRVRNLDDYHTLTKTTHTDGTKLHKLFMDNGTLIKGTRLRVDGLNKLTNTVFELKPYNIRNARKGVKQILNYNDVLGGGYKMVIVLY